MTAAARAADPAVARGLPATRALRCTAPVTPDERFAALAARFADRPGVAVPGSARRGFGSTALRAGRSIVAMLDGERLVVKLPAARVRQLLDDGTGEPLDAGKGRPMKEWAAIPATADDELWHALADEAYAFVADPR